MASSKTLVFLKEPRYPDACPLCHDGSRLDWLRRMRKRDANHDWFRCEVCEHIFTIDRPNAHDATLVSQKVVSASAADTSLTR